jgi:hypothetical protein
MVNVVAARGECCAQHMQMVRTRDVYFRRGLQGPFPLIQDYWGIASLRKLRTFTPEYMTENNTTSLA